MKQWNLKVKMVLATWLLGAQSGVTQTPPASSLYQIISGSFVECCGFAGVPLSRQLPDADQAFIQVTIDPPGTSARMSILGEDMRTVFRIDQPVPPAGLSLSFSNGLVLPNHLLFLQSVGPLPSDATYSYTLTNLADTLGMNGSANVPCVGCADIPTHFTHTNLVARLMPGVMVRVSEIEVRWNAVSNRVYQVQYQADVTGGAWVNLGSPVVGTNGVPSVADRVRPEEARRFYRVVTLP